MPRTTGLVIPDAIALDRMLCERSLKDFVRESWPILHQNAPYVWGWHIDCICEHLQAVTNLEILNLIINVPPGFTKSLAVSVFWFCWVWATRPESAWLYASYGDDLALRDANRCLSLINSEWYQVRWGSAFHLARPNPAAGYFHNDKTGYRIATTPLAIGTGERTDYGVVDDPLKINDAYSNARKREVNKWWDETMSGRARNPDTFRKVVVMQRLAQDDLTGHLLTEIGGYQHLCLPMQYEPKRIFLPGSSNGSPPPKDPITPTSLQLARPEWLDRRQNEGDLLWPQRFKPEKVEELKRNLRAYGTASQFQQRPSAEKGTIYQREWFGYFREEADANGHLWFVLLPRREGQEPTRYAESQCRWFQTCDTALTVEATSNYTCVGTFVVTPANDLLVYDIWRDRLEVPKQFAALLVQRQRYPRVLFQAIESKASGIGLLQLGAAHGMPFRELKAATDKVQRASQIGTLYESGKVYHRAGSLFLTDFEDELLSFPTGAHNDQADVVAYGGQLLTTDAMLSLQIPGELLCWPASPRQQLRDDPPPADAAVAEFPSGRRIWTRPATDQPDERPLGPDEMLVGGHRVRLEDGEDEGWYRR